MNHRFWIACGMLASVFALVASAAPSGAGSRRKPRPARKGDPVKKGKTRPMSLRDARVAVAMLGDAYDLLLEETHATYHTRPSLPVAATVIRQLQARMEDLGWPRARFLAVNAIVMHPNHVPRDDFERRTVRTLRRSNERIEETVDGQLRVATVVPLGGGCSSCHWVGNGQSSKAAMSWNVPLVRDTERK